MPTTYRLLMKKLNKIKTSVFLGDEGIVNRSLHPVEDACTVLKKRGYESGVLLFHLQGVVDKQVDPLCYAYDIATEQYLPIVNFL